MAGEEGGTRGIAERELAVVAVEANAFGGEGMSSDMKKRTLRGRLREWVAGDFWVACGVV
jgi:hypothetical protein